MAGFVRAPGARDELALCVDRVRIGQLIPRADRTDRCHHTLDGTTAQPGEVTIIGKEAPNLEHFPAAGTIGKVCLIY